MPRRITAFVPIIIDLVVPTIGYFILHGLGMSVVWALTVAGSATIVTTAVNTVRARKIDVIGILVVVEVAASVALAIWTDNPRLVLARSALYLAVLGVVVTWSGIAGRPMSYPGARPMATKGDPVRGAAYTAAWQNSAELRRIHIRLSVIIGILIIAYAGLRLAVIFAASSASQAVWAQEIPGIILLVAAIGLIRLHVPKLEVIVNAEQARLTAATPEPAADAAAR